MNLEQEQEVQEQHVQEEEEVEQKEAPEFTTIVYQDKVGVRQSTGHLLLKITYCQPSGGAVLH